MPRPRLRRLRRAFLGLLLAAAALEVVLQVARPAVLDRVRQRAFPVAAEDARYVTLQPINFDPLSGLPLLVYDPDVFWVMAPGRQGAFFLTSDVRTNALGLRGPPIPPRAGADELRLLFLGDSVTFGMRVAEAERYSDRLAARLAAAEPGRAVTAVNAGVIGYAATQVRARLPAWLDAAQPDVVCLAIGLNDCIRLPASDAQFRSLTTSAWERLRHGARRSQLVCAAELGWAWLRREVAAQGDGDRRSIAQWLHYPSLPPEGAHVPRTSDEEFFALLDEIHGLCRDRGVALILVAEHASPDVPSERLRDKGFFERLQALSAGLRDFGARRGLPVADVRAAFERDGRPPQKLLLDFCHPSPAGHELIAAELHRCLDDSGLLARWRNGTRRRARPPRRAPRSRVSRGLARRGAKRYEGVVSPAERTSMRSHSHSVRSTSRALLLVIVGAVFACRSEEPSPPPKSPAPPAPAAAAPTAPPAPAKAPPAKAPPAAPPAAPSAPAKAPEAPPAGGAPKAAAPAAPAAPATAAATAGAFKPEVLKLPADPKDYAPVAKYAAMEMPADNPLTAEKAALGRQLFFDTRLSGDGKRSCYSCHVCEHGLTDGVPLNKGAFDKPLTRHSPTLWNIGFHHDWYWDGRAKTLEAQALAAWKGVNMGASNPDEVAAKINAIPGYAAQFQSVFGGPASADNVSKALAGFMRTIVSASTAWDRHLAGEAGAVSDAAKRGYEVFRQAACDQCHAGVLFTDLQYHNVGIGMKAAEPDVGRFKVTNLEQDTGAFKTPTLRDVSRSAPYFHDGSVPTLEKAVDGMLGGGIDNPHKDARLKKFEATPEQRSDLLEFLRALDQPCDLKAPPLPPGP